MQRAERLQRKYASVACCLEANQNVCVVHVPYVSTLPLTYRCANAESKQVPVKGNTEIYGNCSGKVGKIKVEVTPQNPRKQTMQNSSELA